MKKLFKKILVVLMLICSLTFVACTTEQPKLTDQDVVDAAKITLTINYTEVTTDFTLPTTAAGGVTVAWSSNNEAVVINGQNAYVTRPSFEEGNKEVTLTAVLSKNEALATVEFKVVVVCLEDVDTIDALTVAEAIASEQGATVTVRGIVSGFHSSLYNDAVSIQACYLTDETGTIYVYGYLLAQSVEKGDDIVIQATVGEYKGYTQLTSPTLNQTISKGNEIPTEGAKTDKTVADIAGDLDGNYTAAAYIFEEVQIKKITGADYVSYAVEDANGNAVNVYSGASGVELAWLDEYLGKELKVLFAVNSQNSAGTKWRGHVLDVLEVGDDWDPELNENPDLGGEVISIAEAIASEQGAVVTVKGIVSGFHASIYQDAVSIQACYLTDETGTVYVYGYLLAQGVEKGDEITISATVGEYKGYTQLTSPNLVKKGTTGNEISTAGAKTDKTVADIAGDLNGNYTAAAYIFESVQIKKITGENYVSYAVEDANGNAINVYSGASGVELAWLDEYLGKELKVLFAVNSQNSAGTKWRGHVLEVLEVVGDWDPELNENPDLGGEVISIADAVASEQGAVVTVKGIVSGFHYGKHNNAVSIQACYLTDETGTVYVYGYLLAQGVEKGDEITISATVGEYKGYTQLTSPNLVEKGTTGNEIPTAGAKTDKTLADIAGDLNGNYTACAYLFEGVQIVKITGSGYINYVVEDKAGNAINIYSSADSVEFGWLEEYLGKEVNLLFAVNSQNSAGTKWRGHVLDVLEVVGDWEEAPVETVEVTVTEAIAAGEKLASGATSSEYYIVSGEVVSVDEAYSSQHKNVTFTISDGTNTIKCYRTGGSTASVVAVGDTVTVKAQIENYEGTVELVYGEITERVAGEGNEETPDVDVPATFEGTVSEVYNMVKDLADGETSVTVFTVTALVVDVEEYNSQYNNVTFYITDGTTEMYVYRATGTEAANLKKNDTVTITGKVKNYYGTLEFVEVSITSRVAGEAEEEAVALATITFDNVANRTEFSSSKQVWVQNGITVTNNQAASTSPVADYANPARFYKSSDLTIAYESEFEMIVITTSAGKCYTGSETITGATLSVSAGKMTLVLDEKATSFTITTLATQIRATEISIFSEGTGNSGSEEGGNGDDSGNTETTTDYVTSLETGVAYKFAMVVGNGSTVYLTGKMSSYYGATSTNKADGKDVYLEAVDGGYNMYFMEGDVKTYIVVLVNGTHNNITFTTEASSVWVWDATYNTVTTVTSEGDKVFLGTYGTFTTFSPSNYESYIASNYVGRFYTVE